MEVVFTRESIQEAAASLWRVGQSFSTWAFHGDMGSGKTTFIHALCDVIGVQSAVGSPTYSIINEYSSPLVRPVYHMDWYRLKDEEEAIQAGVEDALFSGGLALVEWPDRAAGLLPEQTLHIYLQLEDVNTRRLLVPSLP